MAISTACGPLDNIVVDTVETAQNCIAYLKSSGVGHATFLCLDKQQRFAHKAREPVQDWPEGVPRLFDLVQVNNEDLLPAFYFALQDTLVAKDMEQATRIAFNGPRRFRVVSLGGGMIEASGAMSGKFGIVRQLLNYQRMYLSSLKKSGTMLPLQQLCPLINYECLLPSTVLDRDTRGESGHELKISFGF